MLKSIRWTLQLWHASLLAAVLVGFIVVSYYGISQGQYERIDDELSRLAQKQRRVHFDPYRWMAGWAVRADGGADPGPIGAATFSVVRAAAMAKVRQTVPAGMAQAIPAGAGPPDKFFIEFPPGVEQRFGDEPGMPYYLVWDPDGKILANSASLEGVPAPEPRTPDWSRMGGPPTIDPPEPRQRGEFRESFAYGPFGFRVVVGRSVKAEQLGLRRDMILLVAAGGGVLLLGLVGGWVISLNVLRPIRAIAETAQEISASQLSRRIDVSATQSELGSLATVLNDMFGRLDSAFQQQVRFTADASHELRTPLSVIHTHSQLALSRERTAEEYRRTLTTCLRASNRMKDLVESLLFLARTDAGRLTLERTPLDLRDVVDDCAIMVSPLASEKKVTIETDLQPAEMTGDASRLAQVATNLLTNAVRYNREGGSMKISVRTEGDEAVLSVADTGVGVPPEHQKHLFERFYRVDVARSRDAGGSGLGLAICKSIVDAHGGQITVQSKVDKGTTFTVRLPRNFPKPVSET